MYNTVAVIVALLAIPANVWDVVTTNANLAKGGTENTEVMAWAQKHWGAQWWLMKVAILTPAMGAGFAMALTQPYPFAFLNIAYQAMLVAYIAMAASGNTK